MQINQLRMNWVARRFDCFSDNKAKYVLKQQEEERWTAKEIQQGHKRGG